MDEHPTSYVVPQASGSDTGPADLGNARTTSWRERIWGLRALIATGLAALIVGGLGGVALAKGGSAADEDRGGRGGFGGPGGPGGQFQRGGPPGNLGNTQRGGPFGGTGQQPSQQNGQQNGAPNGQMNGQQPGQLSVPPAGSPRRTT